MDDFELKYNDLMDKLDDECELAREFFCVAFYSSEHIITIAHTSAASNRCSRGSRAR